MKWPFVLASRLDAIVAGHRQAREMVEVRASTWERIATERQARYDALLEKFMELRVAGANLPEPKPTLNIAKPSGPVADAIDDICARFGNSVKLRRRLMKYAADAKRDAPDMDEEDIAHAIMHWKDPDSDDEAA